MHASFQGYLYSMTANTQPGTQLAGVQNIIAVASGKGGVGKSTTAVNLALALHSLGRRVGLLDADIYGPSIPMMMGVSPNQRPQIEQEKYFLPINIHGIQTISIGNLVTKETPMVWRGPMASGALTQIMTQTLWDEVEYLLVDLPPGTGDIQLTLSQKVAIDGVIIVTTPQGVALQDAIKGIEMFRNVSVPILGIIENMSYYICPNCSHQSHLFGSGGGHWIAEKYKVAFLGSIPLQAEIRESMDAGKPVVLSEPKTAIAESYCAIATAMCEQRDQLHSQQGPEIIIE